MQPERVSIIIEWENVMLSEMDRCRLMLQELHRQIHELNAQQKTGGAKALNWVTFPFDVSVVYNPDIVGGALIQDELAKIVLPDDSCIRVRMAPAAGQHYFDLKNSGAQRAEGGILLFLDSDVIPEPGWLQHLLESFERPEVHVVCGATYIDPVDLLAKTFACTWFFPVRSPQATLVKAPRFYANNLAFRRATFERFPFPMLNGETRGACGRLAVTLSKNGIDIYRHNGARVSHPAPNGLRHFIVRGVAQGRDDFFNRRRREGSSWLLRECWRHLNYFIRDSSRSVTSIARNRKAVGLSLAETPLAAGIAIAFCHFRFWGALMAQLVPGFMKTHFRI